MSRTNYRNQPRFLTENSTNWKAPAGNYGGDPMTQQPHWERYGYTKEQWKRLTKEQRINATAAYYAMLDAHDATPAQIEIARASLEQLAA